MHESSLHNHTLTDVMVLCTANALLQVVGSLTAAGQFDDDDDSIDDDTATDGGDVSRLGSEASEPGAGEQGEDMGYADQLGGSDGLDDDFDDGPGQPESEDSGF